MASSFDAKSVAKLNKECKEGKMKDMSPNDNGMMTMKSGNSAHISGPNADDDMQNNSSFTYSGNNINPNNENIQPAEMGH